MAKLKGILPFEGTIGNITFVKTREGIIVRQKGGVSAERIASDPEFQRTRENSKEFGRAAKGGRLLRTALRSGIRGAADGGMTARLVKLLTAVIHGDITHVRGERTVTEGELTLLSGFEFNQDSRLTSIMGTPFTSAIDRATGELEIALPAFIPAGTILAPQGTTHFRLMAIGAATDFTDQTYVTDTRVTGYLPWTLTPAAPLTLICQVTAGSAHPLVLSLAIEFYQEINGTQYLLSNGAFSAMSVVQLDV